MRTVRPPRTPAEPGLRQGNLSSRLPELPPAPEEFPSAAAPQREPGGRLIAFLRFIRNALIVLDEIGEIRARRRQRRGQRPSGRETWLRVRPRR